MKMFKMVVVMSALAIAAVGTINCGSSTDDDEDAVGGEGGDSSGKGGVGGSVGSGGKGGGATVGSGGKAGSGGIGSGGSLGKGGSGGGKAGSSGEAVSFAKDILPIIEAECGGCHMHQGRFINSYAEMNRMTYDQNCLMPPLKLGECMAKLVVTGKEPFERPDLPQTQKDLFSAWVEGGMKP